MFCFICWFQYCALNLGPWAIPDQYSTSDLHLQPDFHFILKQDLIKLPWLALKSSCVIIWIRNLPHRLMYLNTWSPVGGTFFGTLWNVQFMESCWWSTSLGVSREHWEFIIVLHFWFPRSASCVWINTWFLSSLLPPPLLPAAKPPSPLSTLWNHKLK